MEPVPAARRYSAMIPVGYKVFSVVAGGLLVGALGSSFIHPVPKDPEPQWWQATGRSEIAVDKSAAGLWFEAGPDDLTVQRQDGFAPDWADDGEIWQYRLPEMAEWEPDPLFASDEVAVAEQPATDPAPMEAAAEQAADAVADAQDALAAAEPAPGDVRKSELAVAGLY